MTAAIAKYIIANIYIIDTYYVADLCWRCEGEEGWVDLSLPLTCLWFSVGADM